MDDALMGGEVDRAARILSRSYRQTYHEEGGKIWVRTHQDVEPHMDYCAQRRRIEAEERGRFGKRGDLHPTMSLPFNVLYAAADRLGIQRKDIFDRDCQKRILKELKRPEFAVFRVTNDKRI